MDSDDLTPMAYETLSQAFCIHDALRSEIGASAIHYRNEDDFLRGTLQEVENLIKDPNDYIDMWDLEDEVGIDEFRRRLEPLREHLLTTLSTSIEARGKPPFAGD